jgi:hypothetical protein
MKPLVSLHVVHYSCTNCGEETEEVKMCDACNAPMRVIQVVELYGDEANEYLEDLKEQASKNVKKEKVSEVQFDSSVTGADVDSLGEEDVLDDADDIELGEIFPEDDEEEEGSKKKYVNDLGDDFEAALDILDQEDEDMPDDIEDLPEL